MSQTDQTSTSSSSIDSGPVPYSPPESVSSDVQSRPPSSNTNHSDDSDTLVDSENDGRSMVPGISESGEAEKSPIRDTKPVTPNEVEILLLPPPPPSTQPKEPIPSPSPSPPPPALPSTQLKELVDSPPPPLSSTGIHEAVPIPPPPPPPPSSQPQEPVPASLSSMSSAGAESLQAPSSPKLPVINENLFPEVIEPERKEESVPRRQEEVVLEQRRRPVHREEEKHAPERQMPAPEQERPVPKREQLVLERQQPVPEQKIPAPSRVLSEMEPGPRSNRPPSRPAHNVAANDDNPRAKSNAPNGVVEHSTRAAISNLPQGDRSQAKDRVFIQRHDVRTLPQSIRDWIHAALTQHRIPRNGDILELARALKKKADDVEKDFISLVQGQANRGSLISIILTRVTVVGAARFLELMEKSSVSTAYDNATDTFESFSGMQFPASVKDWNGLILVLTELQRCITSEIPAHLKEGLSTNDLKKILDGSFSPSKTLNNFCYYC
jgi:hypothetical protein